MRSVIRKRKIQTEKIFDDLEERKEKRMRRKGYGKAKINVVRCTNKG
jgi:hypothetical protein